MAHNRFKEETGFSDPLGDCDNFNIVAFINSGDTPVDSPAPQYQQQHPVQQQYQQQPYMNGGLHLPRGVVQQQPGVLNGPNLAYALNRPLPDSPPVTDVSGGNSSGSPGSDPPYSPPEQYAQYQQFQQQRPATAIHMPLPELSMHPQQHQRLMRQPLQQTQVSPNTEFLAAPYPAPTTPAQVSPHQRQTPFIPQQQQQQIAFPMEMYLNENDNFTDILEPHAGQKRRRIDPSIKNEQFHPQPAQTPLPLNSMSSSPHNGSLDDFDDCNHQRTIRFQGFDTQTWPQLYNEHRRPIPFPNVNVVADKGFNFSTSDNCFVNQKKNHFQITVHVDVKERPVYVYVNDHFYAIRKFNLTFCGAKSEMTSSEIPIRQSQTDRKPIKHEAVALKYEPNVVEKVTVPRLHFSETTMNNHRKNGRPNPDQKYFLLVVKFLVTLENDQVITMQAFSSDKVIVRASNPGQFEPPENDVSWQKTNANVLHYNGQVAIGSDKPLENAQLTVMGNLVATGNITRPSDRRVKENITPMDPEEAMKKLAKLRIVEYAYKQEFADSWGLSEDERHRVGVIAQEVADIIPDAVKQNGELMTVDESRLFYQSVLTTQHVVNLMGDMNDRLGQVKQMSNIFAKDVQHRRRMGESMASGISALSKIIAADKDAPGQGHANKELSQSNASINSSTASMDGSASQVGRRRKYRYASARDPELCNSKITQGTMVALVFVMSLCLVTMCTLYVLDWYNRTYVYTPHSFPRSSQIGPERPGNIIDLPGDWKPPSQTLVDPLLSYCSAGGSPCQPYCCSSKDLQQSNATAKHPKPTDTLISVLDHDHTATSSLSKRQAPHAQQTQRGTPKPFSTGVVITIADLGVVVDERFCVEGSCDARKGRYNLYIPISPYVPTMSMAIHVKVEAGSFVDDCGALIGFEHKGCDARRERVDALPDMWKTDTNSFQVSAGDFLQSAYRLRVGPSPTSCQLAESQQGRSFDEYNLVFYRSCSV